MFEGEYLNGIKWNGKGKEFDNDENILFEGEYLNGKRWNGKSYANGKIYELNNGNGIIIEYNKKDGLILEIEYINGEEKKRKEYYLDGKLIFEGEYLNGVRWKGKGIEFDWNGGIFEGEYFDGKKLNGKKKLFWYNGKIKFEGEYINGELKGKEYDVEGNIIFEGEYLNENQWNGKIFGFFGNWNKYECELNQGKYIGDLKIYYKHGGKFIGKYITSFKNRKGKEYDEQGRLIFEGEYINYIPMNGYKKEYNDKGELFFEGEYLNGEKNGHGKEYLNGKVIYEGEYLIGERKKTI